MSDVEKTVAVPQESDALASGMVSLAKAIIANAKAGGGVIVEVSADVSAAVSALAPALAGLGLLGDELKADPIGLAEAFVVAGIEMAKSLAGSPSAAK